jgi:hypothetical protein
MERKQRGSGSSQKSPAGADTEIAPATDRNLGAEQDDQIDTPQADTHVTQAPASVTDLIRVIQEEGLAEIRTQLSVHVRDIASIGGLDGSYCLLGLIDTRDQISSWHSDKIYEALKAHNSKRERDVLLVLVSYGGRVEPAYQISKLCKSFAKDRFVVAVPRVAKSAATLISLGADEIHMGPLGELGPIDTQVGDLPALGVRDALKTIASLVKDVPESSSMWAQYLERSVSVQQIGFYDRVAASMEQYAARLLASKRAKLPTSVEDVAHTLVHEYKDHGFVIDIDEARRVLGPTWIRDNSLELAVADLLYQRLSVAGLWLGFERSEETYVVGALAEPDAISIVPQRK